MTLRVGDRLPNFSLLDENATRRLMFEVMRNRPSVVVWLRHCGCQFFDEKKKEVAQIAKVPTATLIQLVLILQGHPDDAKDFLELNPGWIHCLADPYRSTFMQMGFEKTTFMKILFPTPELKERRKEVEAKACTMNWAKTLKPGNDVFQLPGAVIVSSDGVIMWHHAAKDTSDLPPIATMLDHARELVKA